jgi:ABC-type glycerol-3-phosphate transport system permease component
MTANVGQSARVRRVRRSRNQGIKAVAAYAVLAIMTFVSLYPLALMILNSFKSDTDVLVNAAGLPTHWTLSSWRSFVHQGQMRSFVNSIIVAGSTTILAVFVAGIAAYAFTKIRFRGRSLLFVILLSTMMVPGQITIPPLFLMLAHVHWIDTYQIQIVPFIAPVFGLFMIRQFLLSVPDSLIESARIDGASEWRIYWQIIVPITAPILGAFAILEFLTAWNNYLWPQIMANSHSVAPLAVTIPTLTDPVLGLVPIYGTIMAGSVLATVPLIVVFLRYKNTFITGVTFGAVKE